MLKRIFSSVIILASLALAGSKASAQSGEYMAYTPYSIFGIGDLYQQGSAYHRSMAGVGIASRDVRYLNSLNPASLPVRDTLSFMLDFSLLNTNNIYRQGSMTSARNITNIGSMTLSVPIMKNLAMMAGVSPYSAGGYGYSHRSGDNVFIFFHTYYSFSAYSFRGRLEARARLSDKTVEYQQHRRQHCGNHYH